MPFLCKLLPYENNSSFQWNDTPVPRGVVQLVECTAGGRAVAGSSPVAPTSYTAHMDSLEEQIQAILERKKRVEADKAWEQSLCRRITILVMIYTVFALFLWSIDSHPFLLQALVPAGGYLLSTLSLPWVKERWIKKHK